MSRVPPVPHLILRILSDCREWRQLVCSPDPYFQTVPDTRDLSRCPSALRVPFTVTHLLNPLKRCLKGGHPCRSIVHHRHMIFPSALLLADLPPVMTHLNVLRLRAHPHRPADVLIRPSGLLLRKVPLHLLTAADLQRNGIRKTDGTEDRRLICFISGFYI